MLVKIEVYNDGDHWCARALGEGIFTQGDTLDELMENIREASALYFEADLRAGKQISILVLSESTLELSPTKVS